MIQKYCRNLKYTRNIVLVTNGKGVFDMDGIEDIEKPIKDDSMNLTILCVQCGDFCCVSDQNLSGVNFDDSDYGYKEEEKNPQKVTCTSSRTTTVLISTHRERTR